MDERRRTVRRRSLLGGQIAFGRRSATMDCLVRNTSIGGARLVFDNPVVIPGEFELAIPHRQRSFRTRVVWRRGSELGVAFLDEEPRPGAMPLDVAARIRQLEAERSALQRRVAELTEAG
jgi:hypothetical protein